MEILKEHLTHMAHQNMQNLSEITQDMIRVLETEYSQQKKDSEKIAYIWRFLMNRAKSAANQIQITDEIRSWYSGFINELKEFYRTVGIHLSEDDLLLEIGKKFENQIINEICIPHNMGNGECLIIAASLAKESD